MLGQCGNIRNMLSRNLVFAIFSYGIIGIYTDLQAGIFSTLPGPLNDIFNTTLTNHYGFEPSAAILSLVSTVMSFAMVIGMVICTIFILPQVDKRGRRFVAVKLRLLVGASCSICQFLAGATQSAELYFIGQILVGMSMPLVFFVTQIYMTECSPDANRGFVSTTLIAGQVVASLFMYFICTPSLLGNADNWTFIPIIAFVMSILLFLLTCRLPDSPKWLISKNRNEEAKESIRFYHGKDVDIDEVMTSFTNEDQLTESRKVTVKQVLADDTLKQALRLIIAAQLLTAFSPATSENLYTVVIHTKLGLTVEQSMSVNLFVHLIFSPLRFMGTVLVDKFGRRPVVFAAAALSYSKMILMCLAQSVAFFVGPCPLTVIIAIVNEVLSEFYSASGIIVMGALLLAELIPPAARVSAAQFTMFVPMAFGLPLMLLFPTINTIFAPAFYLPMLVVYPFIILYLYRNLPETNARSVFDIVQTMDVQVRSRANTRFSLTSERNPLLSNGPRKSNAYMAF